MKKKIDVRLWAVGFLFFTAAVWFLLSQVSGAPHIIVIVDTSTSTYPFGNLKPTDPRYEFRKLAFDALGKIENFDSSTNISIIKMCDRASLLNPGEPITRAIKIEVRTGFDTRCKKDGTALSEALLLANAQFVKFNSRRVGLVILTDGVFSDDPSDSKTGKSTFPMTAETMLLDSRMKWVLVGGVKFDRIQDVRDNFGERLNNHPKYDQLYATTVASTLPRLDELLERL